MKIATLSLFNLLLVLTAWGQQQTVTVPISGTYVIPPDGSEILVELKSSAMDESYKGDEIFEIYTPDDKLLTKSDIAVCSFDQCRNMGGQRTENGITYPEGNLNARPQSMPVVPLGITPLKPLAHGHYVIVVRDRQTQKVIHRRVLTLIDPEPTVSGFTATYPNGTVMNGKLRIDPDKDMKNVKLKFEGEFLNEDFKSVKIQGLRLEKGSEPNTYVTGNDWVPEHLRAISLEDPSVVFERYNVSTAYAYGLVLESNQPIINGNLVYKINAGEDRYLLQLNVTNLFPRAQIKLEEVKGGDVLETEGILDGAKIDVENGVISQYIQFNPGVLSRRGTAEFYVQVINRDGKASEVKAVHVQVQESTIVAVPLSESRPFVEDVPNLVKFTRSANAYTFNFQGDVFLEMNGVSSVIRPQNVDAAHNQFNAEIVIPKGTGANAPFELYNNGHVWRGFISGVVSKPEILEESREVYAGGSILLHLKEPNDQVRAITKFEDSRVKQEDNDFSDGAIEISVKPGVPVNSTFTTTVYYKDHVIGTVNFVVIGWPDPSNVVEFKVDRSSYPVSRHKIIVPDGYQLTVQSKNSQNANLATHLTAQLVDTDGTKLGTPQSFVFDRQSKKFSTSLNPYVYGLEGGDEFMVEMVYPSGQPEIQRVYVTRKLIDRFKVNVGVSAVNIFLKKQKDSDGNDLSKTSLVSGVNMGFYYLLEWPNSEGDRPFGIGANLMAQENNDKVDVRLGISTLIYETISFGLNFGDGGPAVFLGASIDFMDLSGLFSN